MLTPNFLGIDVEIAKSNLRVLDYKTAHETSLERFVLPIDIYQFIEVLTKTVQRRDILIKPVLRAAPVPAMRTA